jgi:site-specific recombinase XerD
MAEVKVNFYLKRNEEKQDGTVPLLGRISRVVKIAINNGLLRNDPFIDYEFITSPIVPKSLTSAELKKLMKRKLSRPNLNFIRDMFLFSSFTGIAFSDMRNLTDRNLSIAEDGVQWVHLKRKKTGTPCHIPLLEIPLQLIEKYRGIAEEGKLFPMISCSKTNIYLKRIATECGIDKRVTFHTARHDFATLVTLSKGVPLETVSQMMGHKCFRTTQIYAKLTRQKINADMKKLSDRIGQKYKLPDDNNDKSK